MLQVTYLVKLLAILKFHRLVLALSQLKIVLAYLQVGLTLPKRLRFGIKLDQKLIAILRERGQPIDLILKSLDLL